MRKFCAAVFFLLLCAPSAGAKNLTNGSSLNPAEDSVYTAVTKINSELDVIYGYLNTLYKLQAASSAPSGNAAFDLWFDTAGASPVLKYYTGSTWAGLPAAYTSGITLDQAQVGTSENCTLERETWNSSTVMINASAITPATVMVGANLLQVTGKITLNFTAVADGHYYVYPVRTGSTTAFTLAYQDYPVTTVRTIGEVWVTGGFPVHIASYDSYEHQRVQYPLGLFIVTRATPQATATTYSVIAHDTEISDSENAVVSGVFTAQRQGWYEIHATERVATPVPTTHCIAIYKNSTAIAEYCHQALYVATQAYIFLYPGDTISSYSKTTPGGATEYGYGSGGNMFDTTMWGRWIGTAF
jgi:hypothetical protein